VSEFQISLFHWISAGLATKNPKSALETRFVVMSGGGGAKAVLQVSRRTWDTEEYQRRADERREEEERLEREVREPSCLAHHSPCRSACPGGAVPCVPIRSSSDAVGTNVP